MHETENDIELDPSNFSLTPESGRELADVLKNFGFTLWGHGTPADEAQSFYDRGVDTRGYTGIDQVAVSLSPADEVEDEDESDRSIMNMDMMNDWPHKRGEGAPNVVLMAVPNPEPEEKVYFRHVLEGVIDKEIKAVDPRLVVGFYKPATGNVELNPAFDLNADSHSQWINTIRERTPTPRSVFAHLDHDNPASESLPSVPKIEPVELSDEEDEDWIA